jgi:diguanylate cyclase (GGDEF)-like protein
MLLGVGRLEGVRRGVRGALVLLLALVAVYPLVPSGAGRSALYDAIGALSIGFGWLGLRARGPDDRSSWLLILGGFLGWVIGDALSTLEQDSWHLTYYPLPSDAVYLTSYVVLGAGLLALVRGRHTRHDLSVALDAAIIASGTAVVGGVFVLAPIAEDSTLTVLGKAVSAAYVLADVAMIAILVRLRAGPGARSPAFRLLAGALAVTLLGDIVYNFTVVHTGDTGSLAWDDMLWLSGYLLVAAACWSSSAQPVTRPRPTGRQRPSTRAHLAALAAGLSLPPVTLLLNGLQSGPVRWPIIGAGGMVLSGLAVLRVSGLLRVVQEQAVQLAALADSDALTGAPNRRTWDHELSHACQVARETGAPLCVGLIDLDNFKAFNDTHGHQAGDVLLREVVACWNDLLADGELLARYGGEEFAVLLPGRTAVQGRIRLDQLRRATPARQTFSAGVATYDTSLEPATVVAAADEAMYDAKRSGRNRVCLAEGAAAHGRLPTPNIVLQPIVDLASGALVAVKASSRFPGEDSQAVFDRARQAGTGPQLEAAAIRSALLCRPPEVGLSLTLDLASLTHPDVVEALPADLTGIILEVVGNADIDLDVEASLRDLRGRGARVAIDDRDRGLDLDRLLCLRPEVVKLDPILVGGLVEGLVPDYHAAAIVSVVRWADELGVTVCAEGIGTEAQRRILVTLGVHTGHGDLFGAPTAPGGLVTAVRTG